MVAESWGENTSIWEYGWEEDQTRTIYFLHIGYHSVCVCVCKGGARSEEQSQIVTGGLTVIRGP